MLPWEAWLITVGPSEAQCFLEKEFLRLVTGVSFGFSFWQLCLLKIVSSSRDLFHL